MDKILEQMIDFLKLDLKVNPKIFYNSKKTETNGDEVFISTNNKTNYDVAFELAHEFRHCFQIKYLPNIFDDYKTRNKFINASIYSQQECELDSNAYASYVMLKIFRVSASWNGYDSETKALIKEMVNVIDKSEGERINGMIKRIFNK